MISIKELLDGAELISREAGMADVMVCGECGEDPTHADEHPDCEQCTQLAAQLSDD